MQVNPSINIAIGGYGRSCNSFFHNHFAEREVALIDFASFYNFYYNNGNFRYEGIDKKHWNRHPIEAATIQADSEKDKLDFFFRNLINTVYNRQINLLDQLTENVSFRIVNINLIFGSFEEENEVVVDHLVRHINELAEEGVISNVVVKAFVLLSPDGRILQETEETATFNTLEKVRQIQKQNRNIFTNIFFIDEKNTSAVYLGLNSESIGWILNEVIISLMTNHYFLIGNLMQSDLLSVGLGMIYFDHLFFKRFYRRWIMDELIRREGLEPTEISDNSDYNNLREKILRPSLKGVDNKFVQELVQELEGVKASGNIGSYRKVLAQLLGDFQGLKKKEAVQHTDLISLGDIIYEDIRISTGLTSGTSVMEHKKKLDRIESLQKKIDSYEAENEEGFLDSAIEELKKDILGLRKQTVDEKIHMEEVRKSFTSQDQSEIIKKIQEEIDVERQKINNDLEARRMEHEKQNHLARFLSKSKLKKDLQELESEVRFKDQQRREVPSKIHQHLVHLMPILKLQEDLQAEYKRLVTGAQDLLGLRSRYTQENMNTPLPRYLFVDHVIDEKILHWYFNRNKEELTKGLKGLLKRISSEEFSRTSLIKHCSMRIDSAIDDIIDFNIVDYLLHRYDDLHLLKQCVLEEKLKILDKVSIPFFNAENSFQVDNSHRLVLYSRCSEIDRKNIKETLNKIFTIVPQRISSLNPHKFTFLKIDVIPELDSLVKYNIGKKRVNLNESTNLS